MRKLVVVGRGGKGRALGSCWESQREGDDSATPAKLRGRRAGRDGPGAGEGGPSSSSSPPESSCASYLASAPYVNCSLDAGAERLAVPTLMQDILHESFKSLLLTLS